MNLDGKKCSEGFWEFISEINAFRNCSGGEMGGFCPETVGYFFVGLGRSVSPDGWGDIGRDEAEVSREGNIASGINQLGRKE